MNHGESKGFDGRLFYSPLRSYGRAPKMIHLEANFVQFKEELLPKEGNKALLTFPFLHIYWTDCCVSIISHFVCITPELSVNDCLYKSAI